MLERFKDFMLKEKTRKYILLATYVVVIIGCMDFNLPPALEISHFFIMSMLIILDGVIYLSDWVDGNSEEVKIKSTIKIVAKEILRFIPIWLIAICIDTFILVGEPANQVHVVEAFQKDPIRISMLAIIFAPIVEELIFRLLPYQFIKNKVVYIIVSTLVFAAMHVVNDTNPLYYIWGYVVEPAYWAYRYHKTKNIWVTISMHSVGNLACILLLIFS